MTYSDFETLKAFFSALRISGFGKKPLPNNIEVRGGRIPKDQCFDVLRKFFPEFKEKDNQEILKYFSEDTRNTERLLAGKFRPEEQIELENALAEEVNGQEIASSDDQEAQPTRTTGGGNSPGGGMPGFGMPPAPSISTPHFSINREATQLVKPDIAIANKSGYVAEKPPSEFHVTDSTGNIQTTYSKEPIPITSQSKLVTPGTGPGDASKLVIPGRETDNPSRLVSGSGKPISSETTIRDRSLKSPSAFSNFRSNLGSKINIGLNKGINKTISGINNFGMGGLGGNGGDILGKISNFGKRGLGGALSRGGGKSVVSSGAKKWGLGIVIFFLLFGFLFFSGINGAIPTGEAAPLPGTIPITPSDISQCKFTRSGSSQVIKSSTLASWITNAGNASGIPPAILASIIRHESPSFLTNQADTNEEIKNNRFCNPGQVFCVNKDLSRNLHMGECNEEDFKNGARNAKAMGLMQIVDVHYPGSDLCNIQTSLNLGSQIFKGKLGTGALTNESDVKKAVCAYYGAADDQECTYEGKYHYGQEAWNDYQNCKPASGNVPAPPSDGNYQVSVGKMGINMANGFSADTYKWAFEILTSSFTQFPKFKERLGNSPIEVKPICNISNTSGRVISIRNKKQFCPNLPPDAPEGPTSDPILFKQVFIHELAHIINGSSRPGIYGARIKEAVAQDKGYLTKYAASSTSDPTKICAEPQDANMEDTWADEDFAETISYYINKDTPERDFGCGVYRGDLNPFALTTSAGTRAYEAHYKLAEEVLK